MSQYPPPPGYQPPPPNSGYGSPLPQTGAGFGAQPPQPGYGTPPPPPPGAGYGSAPDSPPPPIGKSGILAVVLALGIVFTGGGNASAMLMWENKYDDQLEGTRADTDNMPSWWEYEEFPDAGISYWKEEKFAPVEEFHDTEDYVAWEAPFADNDEFEMDFNGDHLTSVVTMVDSENTDMPLSDRTDAVAVAMLQEHLPEHTAVDHEHSFELEVDGRPAFESRFSMHSGSFAFIHAKILSVDLGDRVVDVIGFTNRGNDDSRYSEISDLLDSVEILN